MTPFDKPFNKFTKRQRWLFALLAVILFIVLFYGFSIAVTNVQEQYGLNETQPLPQTEE